MRSRYPIAMGLCVLLALPAGSLLPGRARAQARVLPGGERPEPEPFREDEPPPTSLDLPPLPPLGAALPGPLAPGLGVLVHGFRVEGSTVFSEAELAAATAAWSGHEIGSGELLQARDAVTQLYRDAGYLTSGATIPDQSVDDGVVVLRVVEGSLESIEVAGTERFRSEYFRTRLQRAARAPVNLFDIERQLQVFQRDPLVERVRARLEPGSRRGLSRLQIDVEESRFYGLELGFSNGRSPSVGSYTGELGPRVANLLRYGDVWTADFEISEGLRLIDADVSIPLPPYDTRVGFRFQYAEGEVVEAPFDQLDIESSSTTYGIGLGQVLLRTRFQELGVGIVGEYRRSDTRLLGECFEFVAGAFQCESKVSVLRLLGEWSYVTRRNVVAARSVLSLGFHALGSTERSGGLADSEYQAWLGQLQWAHRLPGSLLDSELLGRVDTQLSSEALLGIEKFPVGGMRSVRGYRENQFVRDNGLVASLELRVPLWRDARRRPVVQVAPFFDYGRAWNHESEAQNISSLGIGLRVAPFPWLRGELYWGYALDDLPQAGDDPQDQGIHFDLKVVPF